MRIEIPESCLVLLMGASGAGKTTFAARHFLPTEVLSSDALRAWICDDATDQSATRDAFEVLHDIAGRRLARRRLTVVDATNVHEHARRPLLELARRHHTQVVVIALGVAPELCASRNAARQARSVPAEVVREHHAAFQKSLTLLREAKRIHLVELTGVEAIEAARIVRVPLAPDRRDDRGPFDIIGDVHGCLDELVELIERLGYRATRATDPDGIAHWTVETPPGRRLLFVGDIVDRGPASAEALRLTMDAVDAGAALIVPGNHDIKLMRRLQGRDIKLAHGLAETMDQIEAEGPAFAERARRFIEGLSTHLVLDEGRLVVAHAGLEAHLHGRVSQRVRAFALFGKTTGERDAFGLPVRLDWAADYEGRAAVVYGHTPSQRARWVHNTICIDTGCCFGNRLTALRYPELELDSVPAHQVWGELKAPMRDSAAPEVARSSAVARQAVEHALEALLEHGVETRHDATVRCDPRCARQAAERLLDGAALDARWLIGLPALHVTVAHASSLAAERELAPVTVHDIGAGPRALLVVLRDPQLAVTRFGLDEPARGVAIGAVAGAAVPDADEVLEAVAAAMDTAGLWGTLQSDWVCLDGHLHTTEGRAGYVPQRVSASASGMTGGFGDDWHRRLLARLAAADSRFASPTSPGGQWMLAEGLDHRRGVPLAIAVASPGVDTAAELADRRRNRGRAVRSTALALEALARFVAGEPTARVLSCVLGQLAIALEAASEAG